MASYGTIKALARKYEEVRLEVFERVGRVRNERKYHGKTLLEYRGDPEGYNEYVLKNDKPLTVDQLQLIQAVDRGERLVFCRAGHVVGKSFACAFLVSYLYDTNKEAIIITTAPKLESVRDIIWRELRMMRMRAGLGGFSGPRSIRMTDGPYHLAVGTTARTDTAFHGKHGIKVYCIVDEAVGLESPFWDAIESMMSGEDFALVAIYNPTTTACRAYQEEAGKKDADGNVIRKPFVMRISCLNHPNVHAELRGLPAPYPAAVRLESVWNWINKWCDPLHAAEPPDKAKGDFLFPPPVDDGGVTDEQCLKLKMKRRWYRPGPIGMARIFGLWPLTSVNTFWSEWLVNQCRLNRREILPTWPCTIGVDVARYGDDMIEIMVRRWASVVHHEAHSGWDGRMLAERLKVLATHYHAPNQNPKSVPVYIDETGGWGSSVLDHAGVAEQTYNFIGVNSGEAASDKKLHKNCRVELWAMGVQLAREGLVDLSRLSSQSFDELKKQLLAQTYVVLPTGQMLATDKDDIKDILGRSPDTADALNLCFLTDYKGKETCDKVSV